MNLSECTERIPELRGEAFHVAPLRGGLSNRSFLLTGDFGRWVLRLNEDVDGVDRQRERMVLGVIADEPWAPLIIRNDLDEGYLLYEYRDAPIWSHAHARSAEGQRTVGRWLRRVHAKPASGVPAVDPEATLHRYLEQLPAPEREPLELEVDLALARWQDGIGRWSEALCHLDLVCSNLLGNGTIDGVIDWEFGGRAEPALDLAVYLHYHGLDATTGQPLLAGYGASPALADRVRAGIHLASLLDRIWRRLLEQHQQAKPSA